MSFLKGTFKFAENFLENVDTRAEQFIQLPTSSASSSTSIVNNSALGSSALLSTNPSNTTTSLYPLSSSDGDLSIHDLQSTGPTATPATTIPNYSTYGRDNNNRTHPSTTTTITIHPETGNDTVNGTSSSLGSSTVGTITNTMMNNNASSRLIVYDKDNPQITSLLLEIRTLQQQVQTSKKKEVALEEQIKEGFKETERLRTALTEARAQLSEADFDAIYKLRNEYDTLQQKYMVLNRDYDTLRASSEQNSNSIRETINSSEILVENLQNELMTVRSSSMAREEELVSELAVLTQQIITLKQQHHQYQQTHPSSVTSTGDNDTLPNNALSTDNTITMDNRLTETLASFERELTYERKRYLDCEELNRQLRLSANKELLQKEEYKRNYDSMVLRTTSLEKHIHDLETQIQKLSTNQESYAVLQRTNTDLAKQLSLQTNEIIDCKTKLKASVSLLSQEQHAHALTRSSYDDLQRVVADLQRDKQRLSSSAYSSSSSSASTVGSSQNKSFGLLNYGGNISNPRYPSYNNHKHSSSTTVKFSDFIDRHLGVPVTNLFQSSRKARIGVVLYIVCLQLWTFFLMFLHSHSIPHELHKKPSI